MNVRRSLSNYREYKWRQGKNIHNILSNEIIPMTLKAIFFLVVPEANERKMEQHTRPFLTRFLESIVGSIVILHHAPRLAQDDCRCLTSMRHDSIQDVHIETRNA